MTKAKGVNTLVNIFVGMNVIVSRNGEQPLNGTILGVDNHGIVVHSIAGDGENEQRVGIYLPHKEVTMIHTLEEENQDNPIRRGHQIFFSQPQAEVTEGEAEQQ